MIILGLGSNIEPRADYLRQAIRFLTRGRKPLMRNIKLSNVYESAAVLPEGAPAAWDHPFMNMAISGITDLSPQDLLKSIKRIEKEIGRKKNKKWSPRIIDIDILAYDTQVVQFTDLSIPHPSLFDREFAYLPFYELWPDWNIPFSHFTQGNTLHEFVKKNETNLKPTLSFDLQVFPPLIVGIINITPDSFSDGNQTISPEKALKRAIEFHQAGAQILDIGAESTRPGAQPISPEEEWARLKEPLFEIRSELPKIKISLDSRNPQTVQKAIQLGVNWINDVSGLKNPEMIKLMQKFKGKKVFMHQLGIPANKGKTLPLSCDPVLEIYTWAEERIEILTKIHGLDKNDLIFDPGIGFGKTAEQSFEIIRNLNRFNSLGVEIMVGHSRKSFLNLFTQNKFYDRDIHSVSLSLLIAKEPIDYIRVHNVSSHAEMLRMLRAYQNGIH